MKENYIEKINNYIFSRAEDFEEALDICENLLNSSNIYLDYGDVMQINYNEVEEPNDDELKAYREHLLKIKKDIMFGYDLDSLDEYAEIMKGE